MPFVIEITLIAYRNVSSFALVGWFFLNVVEHILQGSHTSLKVLEFFSSIFKALKVLENGVGA